MTNKKTTVKLIIIILGCCCIIAAAALYVYNLRVSDRAASASDELTGTLTELIEESRTAAEQDEGDEDLLFVDTDAETTETGSADDAEETLETVSVNDYDIVGMITMPTIDIELAVISEWSYPNLKISACRYSGTPSGQLVILAHNYKRHFGLIEELQSGDPVTFTDADGVVYSYEVTGTGIMDKYELNEILSGDWDLTLFTCTYGGANRVVVRCDLA